MRWGSGCAGMIAGAARTSACSTVLLVRLLGQVDGTVVNVATGQPLAGVHVRVFSSSGDNPELVYGAMSDRGGHFSIAQLQAGSYFCQGQLTGFITVPGKEGMLPYPVIHFKAGDRITDFKLELTSRAVIAGRVTDDAGDPVQNATVEALRAGETRAPAEWTASTNDRGEFHISGAPGKYYVRAVPFKDSITRPEVRADGSVAAVYGTTYFPNAMSTERASLVEAASGLNKVQIQLVRQRARSISGLVTGIPQGVESSVILRYGESAAMLNGSRSALPVADGRFSFPDSPPGHIVLFAYSTEKMRTQSNVVEIKPESGDRNDIHLELSSGIDVTGSIDGLGAAPLSVTLRPQGGARFVSAGVSGTANGEGAFRVGPVFPGRYRVIAHPLPENAFVKKVESDGVEAPNGEVEVGAARAPRLKIAVSRNGAQVSGGVLDESGKPLANTTAVVLAMPIAAGSEADYDHSARVSADGKYRLQGIAPGKYRIVVLDMYRSGSIRNHEDAERQGGEEMELKEGDRVTKDLRVAAKQDAAK